MNLVTLKTLLQCTNHDTLKVKVSLHNASFITHTTSCLDICVLQYKIIQHMQYRVYKRAFYEDSQNVVDQLQKEQTNFATTTTTTTARTDDKLKF